MRGEVVFYVNGTKRRVRGEAVFLPLSTYLRYDLALTGTKIVCAEGDCGACTVLIDRPVPRELGPRFRAFNSCILPLGLVDGAHVVTVEAMAEDGTLSEIQARMVEHQGGQCGFCTPGFVMALTALFEEHPDAGGEKRVKNYLTGNLCRCTGYAPIIEAALAVNPGKLKRVRERFGDLAIARDLIQESREGFCVVDGARHFYGPRTTADAVRIRAEHPGLRIFGAATDLGVQLNKSRFELEDAMSLHGIPELHQLGETNGVWEIGARVDLASLEAFLESREPELAHFLHIFASPQIKNGATLAGNLVNASPIADTPPYLLAAEAELELASPRGTRRVPFTKFYQGYKKIDLAADELLVKVRVPAPPAGRRAKLYKVSQRRDLDISAVNACFLAHLGDDGRLQEVRVAYGGVGPTSMRLPKTEVFLEGKVPSEALGRTAAAVVCAEITPISDARGSKEFRLKIAENLLRRWLFEITPQVSAKTVAAAPTAEAPA